MFDQHNSCFCKLNICSENTLCICIVRPSLYPLSTSSSQHSLSESWPASQPNTEGGTVCVWGLRLWEFKCKSAFVSRMTSISVYNLWQLLESLWVWFWAFKHNLRLNNRSAVSAVFSWIIRAPIHEGNVACGGLTAETQSVQDKSSGHQTGGQREDCEWWECEVLTKLGW